MRIAIGSTNPVKCQAVRAVLAPIYPGADFVCVDAPSGVAAQPMDNAETRTGALNRAWHARAQAAAQMGIGLEGGVQESEFGLMTCAWCVIVGADDRIGVGGNSSILLPEAVADDVRNGIELGEAMDRLAGTHNSKHHDGAIGILTDTLETRQSAYESLIRLALAPFRHPAWYPQLAVTEKLEPVDTPPGRGK